VLRTAPPSSRTSTPTHPRTACCRPQRGAVPQRRPGGADAPPMTSR
jgi:hypothetical protein